MMLRPTTVIAVVLGAFLWSSAEADSVSDELRQAEERWTELWNAKDAAGLSMTYTEDGMRLPPDGSRVQGRKALQEMFEEEFGAGQINRKLEPTDVGYDGNLAWVVGDFSFDFPTEGGAVGTATGNYTAVYRKEADGVWRIVVATWNDAPSE